MSFQQRVSSDFQSLYPQSPLATAPLEFPPNGYDLLTGKDDLRSIKPRPSVEDQDRVLRSGNLLGK